MVAMEYTFINGVRDGSKLLHVMPEDMLYSFKARRRGAKIYICYQTILAAEKKNGEHHGQMKCTSRVKIHRDGKIDKMAIPHTNHKNHEFERRELAKRNNMIKACRILQQEFPEDAHRVKLRHIYQREIAK